VVDVFVRALSSRMPNPSVTSRYECDIQELWRLILAIRGFFALNPIRGQPRFKSPTSQLQKGFYVAILSQGIPGVFGNPQKS